MEEKIPFKYNRGGCHLLLECPSVIFFEIYFFFKNGISDRLQGSSHLLYEIISLNKRKGPYFVFMKRYLLNISFDCRLRMWKRFRILSNSLSYIPSDGPCCHPVFWRPLTRINMFILITIIWIIHNCLSTPYYQRDVWNQILIITKL